MEMLATEQRLDFIINNACQTVRRPRDFYEHMRETETAALSSMPEHVRPLLGSYESAEANLLMREKIEIPAALGRGLSELAEIPRSADQSQGSRSASTVAEESTLFPRELL